MKAGESRAEVYLMALQSLSKAEKEVVIARLLKDPQLREDMRMSHQSIVHSLKTND